MCFVVIFVWVLQTVKCAVGHELAACISWTCATISQAANHSLSRAVQLGLSLPMLAIETYPVGVEF